MPIKFLPAFGKTLVYQLLIFDVKLGENFRRKARLVTDGHHTKTPASLTYSSVVSRDSVRICLLLAALNGLQVKSADIKNAYLTAPPREKLYTWAGPEFGHNEGKPFIITKALYGLKSSGASFRSFLAEHLEKQLGFQSTVADQQIADFCGGACRSIGHASWWLV